MWGANLLRWHGERDNINSPFDPLRSPMASHMGGAGLKECPSFRDFPDQAGQASAFEAGCGGYGYNSSYIGGRNDLYGMKSAALAHSASDKDIANPGATVMFTDSAFVSANQQKIAYSFCEPPFWQIVAGGPPSTSRPSPSIHFRHLGKANVAWADSHVTSHELSFSVKNGSKITGDEAVKQAIGWFGPDDNSLFDLK